MARYIGPKSRIARKFRDPIFGPDKHYDKKSYPPECMVRPREGLNNLSMAAS